jgi:hypothetical protein
MHAVVIRVEAEQLPVQRLCLAHTPQLQQQLRLGGHNTQLVRQLVLHRQQYNKQYNSTIIISLLTSLVD